MQFFSIKKLFKLLEFVNFRNEKENYPLQFNKFQQFKNEVQEIGVNYSGIRNKPLKIIGVSLLATKIFFSC